jgi:hypothetical protein
MAGDEAVVTLLSTTYILMRVIAHVMHCWNRSKYISASRSAAGRKNTVAIRSRERKYQDGGPNIHVI